MIEFLKNMGVAFLFIAVICDALFIFACFNSDSDMPDWVRGIGIAQPLLLVMWILGAGLRGKL